jgi:hypothetical protein
MSEEQVQEQEERLVNPQEETTDAQEEAPIPVHEEVKADDSNQENNQEENEKIERPDYYPEKFWGEEGPDIEKLAKSYNELEKQFRSGKHKAPDGDYNIEALVEDGLDPEDPGLAIITEWAKENGVSQKAFDELTQQIFAQTKDIAEQQERDLQSEMQKLGPNAKEKIAMAERLLTKAPLTPNERDTLANTLNSAPAINAFLKYHQSITNESIPVNAVVNTPQISKLDLEQAIADPRWKTDAAWRQSIEKQWMEANS